MAEKEEKKLKGCPFWKVPCIREDCEAYRDHKLGKVINHICHALGGIRLGTAVEGQRQIQPGG